MRIGIIAQIKSTQWGAPSAVRGGNRTRHIGAKRRTPLVGAMGHLDQRPTRSSSGAVAGLGATRERTRPPEEDGQLRI